MLKYSTLFIYNKRKFLLLCLEVENNKRVRKQELFNFHTSRIIILMFTFNFLVVLMDNFINCNEKVYTHLEQRKKTLLFNNKSDILFIYMEQEVLSLVGINIPG